VRKESNNDSVVIFEDWIKNTKADNNGTPQTREREGDHRNVRRRNLNMQRKII
jgi:hypothetical protein